MSAEKPADAAPVADATPAQPDNPLTKLAARLPTITQSADHTEMWGVQLADIEHVPTKVVLQKFLRANNDDAAAAEEQLTSALKWRKKMQPEQLVNETFDKKKFDGLGYVTVHEDQDGKETVITFNIYGSVKDKKATFGDIDEFIRWRAAIMELGVQRLKLSQVTKPIPEGGEDPYQMIQVHDYLNISFFRMDPAVKAASKETISVFSMAYPELLAHKYFVNVPAIMGWMFGAMKLFLAPATLRKFHPMTSGTTLVTELKGIASSLPKEYGGQGPSVKEGTTVHLADTEGKAQPASQEAAPEKPAEKAPETEEAVADKDKSPEEVKLAYRPKLDGITADEAKPANEVKPADEAKPANEAKPVDEPKTADGPKAAEEAKPVEGTQLSEAAETVEEAKPADDAKPADAVETDKKETTAA